MQAEFESRDRRLLYQFPLQRARAESQLYHRLTNAVFYDLMRNRGRVDLGALVSARNVNGGGYSVRPSGNEEEGGEGGRDFAITRVRFRPGYSRIWRTARTNLKQIYHLPFQYQRPLTRYLGRLRRTSITLQTPFLQMRIDTVLAMTHFFWDTMSSRAALVEGLVYLNGYGVSNASLYVVPGDLLQTVVSLQYYVGFMGMRQLWQRQA
jgi:hypothetical protein